ncbi:50S ribosomal protein L22 [Candidatus Woesebacteria bacterium]|nr:50S ribosomal protein L22 [Candidatus Woesebacteria bacterium]QQG47786.1 MAG: 50S ribosomal protein L22 [Candidatus Woesebacteria bacterium]
MKDYTSTQKFVRISPRKVRLVTDAIKDMKPMDAIEVLPLTAKRAALPVLKVIKTAIANAVSQGANQKNLYFKEIQVGEGPRLKRGNPASRGMFKPYKKRMSHIRVVIFEKNGTKS